MRTIKRGFKLSPRRVFVTVGLLLPLIIVMCYLAQLPSQIVTNLVDIDKQGYQRFRSKTTSNNLLVVADGIHKTKDIILVTFINRAFLPIAYNWLCNTKEMSIHDKVLIATVDEDSFRNLSRDWPEVTSVFIGNIAEADDLIYGTVSFEKMVYFRIQIILELLERNFRLLLFEVDYFWYKNPLPMINTYKNYDMVMVSSPQKHNVEFEIGFIYLNPTNVINSLWKPNIIENQWKINSAVKKLWRSLSWSVYVEFLRIEHLAATYRVSEPSKDQKHFSKLVNRQSGTLNYKLLSASNFVDGHWYSLSEEEQKSYNPIILHNNLNIDNNHKITTAKIHGHWFVNESLRCDLGKIRLLSNSSNFQEFYQNTRNKTAIESQRIAWKCLFTTFMSIACFVLFCYTMMSMMASVAQAMKASKKR